MAGLQAYMGRSMVVRWSTALAVAERRAMVERRLALPSAQAASRGITVMVLHPEDDLQHRTHVVVGEHLGDLLDLEHGQVAILHLHHVPESRQRAVEQVCTAVRTVLEAMPEGIVEPADLGLGVVVHRPLLPPGRQTSTLSTEHPVTDPHRVPDGC